MQKLPKVKGFRSRGIGGYKMQKKSWDSSEIDKRLEDKKIMIIVIAFLVFVILMLVFIWWTRKSLS